MPGSRFPSLGLKAAQKFRRLPYACRTGTVLGPRPSPAPSSTSAHLHLAFRSLDPTCDPSCPLCLSLATSVHKDTWSLLPPQCLCVDAEPASTSVHPSASQVWDSRQRVLLYLLAPDPSFPRQGHCVALSVHLPSSVWTVPGAGLWEESGSRVQRPGTRHPGGRSLMSLGLRSLLPAGDDLQSGNAT